LGAAQDAAVAARGDAARVSAVAEQYAGAGSVPSGVDVPDVERVRSAVRGAAVAGARVEQERARVDAAVSRWDAARRMALEAREVREAGGRAAAREIDAAAEAGIAPRSWWDSVKDAAGKVWDVVVTVAKVAVVVLTVVAIIAGGPLLWGIVLGLSLILLTDAVAKYARGEASGWDVAFAALGCIPGGRGLSTFRAMGNAFKAAGSTARGAVAVGAHLGGAALAQGRAAVTGMTHAVRAASNGGRHGLQVTHDAGFLNVLRLLGLDGSSRAGARIRDLAAPVPGGSRAGDAIHAGSADAAVLRSIFRHEYGDLASVNAERYARGLPGFNMNCTRCVITADAVLTGHAASAMPVLSQTGAPVSDVAQHFGRAWQPVASYADIVSKMEALGEGARAVVFGQAPVVGHVFTVVHDRNGIVFLDSQIGFFAHLVKYDKLYLLTTAP
jgi:hypothetical protein